MAMMSLAFSNASRRDSSICPQHHPRAAVVCERHANVEGRQASQSALPQQLSALAAAAKVPQQQAACVQSAVRGADAARWHPEVGGIACCSAGLSIRRRSRWSLARRP
jgi:hypothetical protein